MYSSAFFCSQKNFHTKEEAFRIRSLQYVQYFPLGHLHTLKSGMKHSTQKQSSECKDMFGRQSTCLIDNR